ncbi:MAG: phosphodiester glycosidase family protein [Verrucomicrobiota bacterium JB022]|nr:phosphodiester glycosidase family protein [Verrucomicrobiota bacterium JB022]
MSLHVKLPAQLLGLAILTQGGAHAQIDLGWQKIDRDDLPPSIELYQSTQNYPNGNLVSGRYALIDLDDPNLELDIEEFAGSANRTPAELAATADELTYVVSNGSFFNTSNGTSLNILLDDGVLVNDGGYTDPRTWGMFVRDADGALDTLWGYPAQNDLVLGFPQPNQNLSVQPHVELDGEGNVLSIVPSNGFVGTFTEAIAARPVLIDNGVKTTTAQWDREGVGASGSFTDRNPRTVIGVTADNKLILMVIDGRQAEHSAGASLYELQDIMLGVGAVEALNLDGGGSSSLAIFDETVTQPSDLEGARAVPNFVVIRRKAQVYDTQDSFYAETAGFIESGNAGYYGESKTRLVTTVDPAGAPSAEATYTVGEDLPPARYELSSYWVGASNRSNATPYTVKRAGFNDVVYRVDQTINSGDFNYVATLDLAPGDQIVIGNNAPGSYVAVDAMRLRYVGESAAQVSFPNGSRADVVHNDSIEIPVDFRSPNSGVKVQALRVYRSVDGGTEELISGPISLNDTTADSYVYSYTSSEAIGAEVALRFELEDDRGELTSATQTLSIKPFAIGFDPNVLEGEHRAGGRIEFDVNMDTQNPASTLQVMYVYRRVDGGEFELIDTVELDSSVESVRFEYLVREAAGSNVEFKFEVGTSDGNSSESTYTAEIVPAKGDITLGFVSDFNGSYGSTTYDARVRQAFDFWVNQDVDAVVSAGDMIAGESSALSKAQVMAMWQGFNGELYGKLKNADIPFVFTMGNHDGAITVDREAAVEFWAIPDNKPDVQYVDESGYPFNWSAVLDLDGDSVNDVFFTSIDSANGAFSQSELDWLDATLGSPEAQSARVRMITTHLSLYAVATERNDIGSLSRPRQPILDMMEEHDVQFFVFGHSAAYFPGQRYGRLILSTGEMGGGGKAYVGEAQQAPSTITRADIFFDDEYYGENAIVLTTYDLFDGFSIVKNSEVPSALFGYDGDFIMRNDIEISDRGAATLSALNVDGVSSSTAATASAQIEIVGGEIVISGSFANLEGKLLRDRTAISLYRGRNSFSANLLEALEIDSVDGKNGTFEGRLPLFAEFRDGLAIGLYGIKILTDIHPEGELRGQFFNDAQSGAPKPAVITSQNSTDTYGIRDVPALYPVSWQPAQDPEQGVLTYTYQLATDASFNNLLIDAPTGVTTRFNALTESEWYVFLADTEAGETRTFYQRVIASDGQNVVASPAQALVLTKDDSIPDEAVEVAAPNYTLDGVFAQTSPWHAYDIAIDEVSGRVWAVNYNGGVNVYNPDGSEYFLSSENIEYDSYRYEWIQWEGTRHGIGSTYGIDWDSRGFMILSEGGDIWKLDATTGEPLAYYDGSFGVNAVVDDNGRIFCHGVFTSTAAYILEEDPENPKGYRVYSRVDMSGAPSVVRTTSYSPEGDAVYLPDATASRRVSRFTSDDDGLTWTREADFEMNAPTGSNAVVATENDTVYLINNKSTVPPTLIFRDFERNLSWSLALEGDLASDIRAFTISRDKSVFYVGDISGRVFKYSLKTGNEVPEPSTMSLAEAVATNAEGEAVNAGTYVRTYGVVTSANFGDEGTLDFFLQDGNAAVRVFQPAAEVAYAPVVGHRIEIVGTISQVAGQTRIGAAEINLVDETAMLPQMARPSTLQDKDESALVRLRKVSLVDPSQWTNDGYAGFTVQVTDGEQQFDLFVHRNSPLFGEEAPQGEFAVNGFVVQFDPNRPYTSGYELMPRNTDDFAAPEATFGEWAETELAGYDEALQAPTADADGDGISNLLEYIWQLDPTAANGNYRYYMQVGQSVTRSEADGERYVSLIFYRPSGDLKGFDYTVQTLDSLSGALDWQALPAGSYQVTETDLGGAVEIVVQLLTPVEEMTDSAYIRVQWEGAQE